MERIVVTAFNDFKDYFYRGMVMISSLHKSSLHSFDKILIYNLGFSLEQKEMLSSIAKVEVIEFPEDIANTYEGYLIPNQFAWKPYILKKAGEISKNVLWLDAGIAALKDIEPVFDIIEDEEIFLVNNSAGQYIKNLTHKACIDAMNADEKTLNSLMISAAIIGYKSNGSYQQLIDEADRLSKIKSVCHGSHDEHRHDQSIYSILSIQSNAPRQSFERYSDWRLHNRDQYFWLHRGEKMDMNDIKLKNGKKFSLFKYFSIMLKPKLNSYVRRIKLLIVKILKLT